MKVFKAKPVLIILLGTVAFTTSYAGQAGELGRLFLNSKQRVVLERKRYKEPEPEIVVKEDNNEQVPISGREPVFEELPDILPEEEPVLTEPLTLKGVVTRSNGKNTAWINDTNTLDGDSVMQDVEVHGSDIDSDGVKIKLPDNVTEVTLKVGQTYEEANDSGQNVNDN